MKIKILTFNIQHLRNYNYKNEDRIDPAVFGEALKRFDADIVTLNEVRGAGPLPGYTAQAKTLAGLAGYEYYYFGEAIKVGGSSPYGNAVLSRFPFDAETVPVPDPQDRAPGKGFESRCAVKASFRKEGKKFTVVTAHFGLNSSEAVNAAQTVAAAVGSCGTEAVLTGDFNLDPSSPVLEGIRSFMYDTADMIPGEALSFPSDGPSCKIDYIFTTRGIKTVSARIIHEVISDHCPYEAVIEI